MSIPPLVCSTPPPPEQCEEDKDPDDFDIPYNLSQDDDDDGFSYGAFSSYNHYESNSVIKPENPHCNNVEEALSINKSKQVIEIVSVKSENIEKHQDLFGTNITNEIKLKCDEDMNIEDLGLEVNEESISSSEREGDEQSEVENDIVESSVKDLEVTNEVTEDIISNMPPSPCDVNTVETIRIDHCADILDDAPIDEPAFNFDVGSSEPANDAICTDKVIEPVKETNLDDDFGDFDDFHIVSSENKISAIDACENPWDNDDADNGDSFGEFTANFDTIEGQHSPIMPEEATEKTHNVNQNIKISSNDEDEDFGDFDDFKSSVVDNKTHDVTKEVGSKQQLPVLNFQTSDNEHQVMESITKVLSSIFEDEIAEPETEFEGKLESMLSETWGHLRETDVRQPYIINWNNSLGQKTLLRALCIDSRNILFGPKWGYNMPKYAVNLSAAPLQPYKPLAPSNPVQSEASTAEKSTAKASSWTDPFSADGQESCNPENESVVEVTPTALDVFEAAISTKSDKIYSSTLNVQPMRQISLPDTHIFTPTDSETPTSKTVHYDSGPPLLLPQALLESSKKAKLPTTQQKTDTESCKDDDDFWEFQDFKSNSKKTTSTSALKQPQQPPETSSEEGALKPNVTYQTQVLLPIKMEPLMPTVNWPAPGEIKETFDDFSDFVSNSSWNDKSQISTLQTENKTNVDVDVLDKINDKHKNDKTSSQKANSHEDLDDEFDTFQSALPPKHINSLGSNTFGNIPSQNSSQIPDFDHAFPKINNFKSDVISVNNPTRPNEVLTTSLGYIPNSAELASNKSSLPSTSQMSHNLLQPTATNLNFASSQNQQKSGQILQPLSLESYSQINWPNPGIDLQDLSRFNPVETLQSLKSDLSVSGPSKVSSPIHSQKSAANNQAADEDIWGEFVSSKPKQQAPSTKKLAMFGDDDEWTDFVSSPSVKPQNGLNTISLNVHTNSNIQKSNNLNKLPTKNNQIPLDIPTLNYITPKSTGHNSYSDRHFQNL